MKNSWRQLFRRLAAGCVVCGSAAWSSAVCYAVQLAYDSGSDPVYSDGWQAGDNGGFGFTPWNFDAGYFFNGTLYAYAHPGFHAIDDGLQVGTHYSNPFNNIGKSWAMGTTTMDDGAPRYGRGFPALQVGQTLSAIIDNPTKRQFFKGYFVQLNGGTGGVNGNICNNNHSCSTGGTGVNKLTLWRFEYFDYGIWQLGDNSGDFDTTLHDTETAAAGMRFDVTRTGTDSYDLSVTPLGTSPAAPPYAHSGTFRNPGTTVDWFSIVFFNPTTDLGTPPTSATDMYIRSLEITGPAAAVPGDFNNNGKVDAADYVLWRNGGPLQNEVSDVGQVTAQDYTDWRARFGNPGAGAGSALGSEAIPEPATGALFVFAVGTLIRIGTNRRRQAE